MSPGDRVADRYLVERALGEGGMGVVLLARDERLGRRVAIKVLPRDRVGDAESRARLLREARAAAAIEDPSIVRVYDVGETSDGDDGAVFVVMELVSGESLRERLGRGLPPRDVALRWLREIGGALDAAHRKGFVHRDVKPENVMIREDGRAVLLDFGLARPVDGVFADTVAANERVTSTGAIVGTPAYLAPEQARGEPLGPACDQFALAIVAFELIVSGHPWQSPSGLVLARMMSTAPRTPSSVRPDLPSDVDPVFARALAKEPAERFPDVGAFVRALEASLLVGGEAVVPETVRAEPVRAEPVAARTTGAAVSVAQASPSGARTTEPARPRDRRASPVVALLAAAVVVGAGLWVARSRTPPATPATSAAPLTDDAVVACPVFVVEGDLAQPAAWLGAAAGTAVCRQIRAALGGRLDAVRLPAALLGLPKRPTDDFPNAAWDAPDVRARTVAAAKPFAAHVDGEIRAGRDAFALHVVLRSGSGKVLGEVREEASTLPEAALRAVTKLRELGALPKRAPWAAEPTPIAGVASVEGLMLLESAAAAIGTGGERAACEAATSAGAKVLGAAAVAFPGGCDDPAVAFARTPKVDLALPDVAFFWTNGAALAAASPAEATKVANEAATRAKDRPASMGRYLRLLEAQARQRAGDLDAASSIALSLQEDFATDPDFWQLLAMLTFAQKSFGPTARAAAAWHPDAPGHWGNATREIESVDARLPLLRRALLLGRRHPLTSINIATGLLRAGKVHEARLVAAQLLSNGDAPSKVYGELLMAEVEGAEGKIEAGLARLRAALKTLRLGDVHEQNWVAVTALDFAQVLGKLPEVGEEIVDGMIVPEPPRVELTSGWAERAVACTCLFVTGDLRKRCGARLSSLRDAKRFEESVPGTDALVAAATKLALGDQGAAIAALKPLLTGSSYPCRDAIQSVLDAAHVDDVVERMDREVMSVPGAFNGVGMAWVRTARRLAARGDKARAAVVARKVLDAWATTDATSIPWLETLRKIADEAPASPK